MTCLGCFTCRRRRIKCDELKPTCGRCTKSFRDCYYSVTAEFKTETRPKEEEIEENVVIASKLSESPDLHPVESSEAEETTTQDIAVVRFSCASSQTLRDTLAHPLNSPQSLETEMDSSFSTMDLLFDIPNLPMDTFTFESFDHFNDPLFQSRSSHLDFRPQTITIPRSPESNRHHLVDYFLKYHLEAIRPGHYFLYYDYIQLCNCWLPAMAAASIALRHALVAFSALVYSIKVVSNARQIAYFYYALALKELRLLLDGSLSPEDCNVAIAAALQLSSFDRFIGDTGKSFSHLKGVAHIMQTYSDPVKICSSALGRSLLEWYCMFEDHCCFGSAAPTLLPKHWRHENCRIRRKLTEIEYSRLSKSKRRERLLDDLWPQFYSTVTNIADVLSGLPLLRTLDSLERSEAIHSLKNQLDQVRQDFREFVQSSLVIEIFQPSEHQGDSILEHSLCCPSTPHDFAPYILQFPPAAHLRIAILSVQIYMRSVIYPLLCGEEFEDNDGKFDIYEMCQTFAGLECVSSSNQDDLLPVFSLLVTAMFTCPPELQKWLWHKLAHFKVCGPFSKPIMNSFSVYWKMPLNATEDLSELESDTPENQTSVINVDELVELATTVARINLTECPNP